MEQEIIYYIITKSPRKLFDHKGKIMGYSPKMAIFYLTAIGTSRIYRRQFDGINTGLKLLAYKTEKSAMEVCNYTNKVHNEGYVVEKIIVKKRTEQWLRSGTSTKPGNSSRPVLKNH